MTALDRLRAAESDAQQGRHAQALQGFLWFHHNALAENQALGGVRLSFALASWLDLAQDYPPAMAALQALRDDGMTRLRAGTTEWALFHDVVAFNEALEEEDLTYRLFCDIVQRDAGFASRCARAATPAMIKAGDFALARSYLLNPEETVRKLTLELAEEVEASRTIASAERRNARLEAHLHLYSENVAMLVKIVGEAGEPDRASELLSLSLRGINEPDMRDAVRHRIAR